VKKMKMTMARAIVVVLCCICFNIAWAAEDAPTPPKSKREAAAAWTEDGLQKVDIKGLDLVYVRENATLGGYDKIMLRPISVAFRRNWEKTAVPGSNIRIDPKDSQRIKDNLAGLIREEVIKQLSEGGYKLTDTPADDVLEVELKIVDLNVRAPNVRAANRTNIYAVSAGEMTLIAELRDSATSDPIMRIFDHAEAHESTYPRRIMNIDNIAEARIMASAWARALRTLIDAARGVPQKQ
jgi:hypothetical protein